MKVDTQEQLLELVKALQNVGAHKVRVGDVEVEMLPSGYTPEEETQPSDQSEGEWDEETLFYSSE